MTGEYIFVVRTALMLPSYFLFQAVPGKVEAELANGLICGHAYSITAVRKVSIGKVFNMSFIAESKKNPKNKQIWRTSILFVGILIPLL